MVVLNSQFGRWPGLSRSRDKNYRAGAGGQSGNHGDRSTFDACAYLENRLGDSGASPMVNRIRPLTAQKQSLLLVDGVTYNFRSFAIQRLLPRGGGGISDPPPSPSHLRCCSYATGRMDWTWFKSRTRVRPN